MLEKSPDYVQIAEEPVPGAWTQWFEKVRQFCDNSANGATADRPTKGLFVGKTYFDTTLGQPIWYNGTGWVDATGSGV